jgi:phosphatidate cytidylyltransferase
MKKRIVFGSLMIAGVVGLFTLDWWVSGLFPSQRPAPWAMEWFVSSISQQSPVSLPPGVLINVYPLEGLVIALLAAVLVVFSLREISDLMAHGALPLLKVSALVGALAVAAWPFYSRFLWPALPISLGEFVLIAAVILLAFAEQMIRFRIENALAHLAGTFLAVLYLGVGTAFIVSTRLNFGILPLVLFLVAVKFTDIGAYFTGSAIGKHKMIPWLSPGKTWEGLAGGLVAAAGMSMLVVAICRAANFDILWPPGLSYAKTAIFGVIVGLAGQFGDLCESLLKRSAGAKDSGAVVPEFGGLLDILDSPLLAAPVAYVLLAIMAR